MSSATAVPIGLIHFLLALTSESLPLPSWLWLRRVVTGGSGRPSIWCIHSHPEIFPSFLGDIDVGARKCSAALLHDVQKNEQVLGSPIQDAVEFAPVVAAQFAQLPLYLRAERKRQRRCVRAELVQQPDCA